jgi:hypothetical protein
VELDEPVSFLQGDPVLRVDLFPPIFLYHHTEQTVFPIYIVKPGAMVIKFVPDIPKNDNQAMDHGFLLECGRARCYGQPSFRSVSGRVREYFCPRQSGESKAEKTANPWEEIFSLPATASNNLCIASYWKIGEPLFSFGGGII